MGQLIVMHVGDLFDSVRHSCVLINIILVITMECGPMPNVMAALGI